MDEKKIIYVHTGIWPTSSPSIVFITGSAYGLAHHVPTILIVRNKSEKSTDEIFHSVTGDDKFIRTDDIFYSIIGKNKPEKLDIIRMGEGGKTPGNTKFFWKTVSLIGSLAKKGDAGAVITRSIGFLPYLSYIRFKYKLPCFFETHDFFSDLSVRTDLKKTLLVHKKHMFEKLFLPRLDGIICLNNAQAELFGNMYPSKSILVARTGLVGVERVRTLRKKQLCYIGSLDRSKGLKIILSALALTADKDVTLLVIGGKNDHEISKLMDLAHLSGVRDRVTVSGWVYHSNVGSMMDKCIAGLVPLTDTPFNRHLTSPLKILDYLAHSLPVIASDLPTVRELIED